MGERTAPVPWNVFLQSTIVVLAEPAGATTAL
jgi:hypothetical protein